MSEKETPSLNAVEADISVEFNPQTKVMSISFVWHEPVSRITATIPFNPTPENEPNSRKADDPV